jgi:hypothetical protein
MMLLQTLSRELLLLMLPHVLILLLKLPFVLPLLLSQELLLLLLLSRDRPLTFSIGGNAPREPSGACAVLAQRLSGPRTAKASQSVFPAH